MFVHQSFEGTRSAFSLSLLKVSGGSRCDAVVQSSRPIWLDTHWIGRQILCPGIDCPFCESLPSRSQGYLVVTVDVRDEVKPFLLEFTGTSALRFTERLQFFDLQLKSGLEISLWRKSQRTPLVIEPGASDRLVDPQLAEDRRLLNAISVIFGLPLCAAASSREIWAEKAMPVALKWAEAMNRKSTGDVVGLV